MFVSLKCFEEHFGVKLFEMTSMADPKPLCWGPCRDTASSSDKTAKTFTAATFVIISGSSMT